MWNPGKKAASHTVAQSRDPAVCQKYIYINIYMHGCNLLSGENKTHTHTQKEAIVKLLQISSTNQNKSDENFNLSLGTFTLNDSS